MDLPGIFKFRFASYLKCCRPGYMACFPQRFGALADPLDSLAQNRIETGNRAGQLASERFPGGVLVGYATRKRRQGSRQEREVLWPEASIRGQVGRASDWQRGMGDPWLLKT
jgi:hypothetical protein